MCPFCYLPLTPYYRPGHVLCTQCKNCAISNSIDVVFFFSHYQCFTFSYNNTCYTFVFNIYNSTAHAIDISESIFGRNRFAFPFFSPNPSTIKHKIFTFLSFQ